MKKLLAIALLVLTTACAQTETSGMMDKGMMCEKCPCCQKMMGGDMNHDMMKEGMQCPMMKDGAKDGNSCGCCGGMMKDKAAKTEPKQSLPKTAPAQDEHSQHH